jgi:hypothetical protein
VQLRLLLLLRCCVTTTSKDTAGVIRLEENPVTVVALGAIFALLTDQLVKVKGILRSAVIRSVYLLVEPHLALMFNY